MSSFRIAHVLESAAAGAGRHVLDLAQGMSQQGHDIIIIWSPDRASPDFIDRILRLPNVSSYSLPMQRAIGWHDIHSLNQLTRLLSDIGPFDILHGHSSKAGALVRLLPRKIPGARVYTPHAFRAMDPNLGECPALY